MNGDKVVERDKILQVMEKYRDYFKEWNADVAFGTNKSNIFYVLAPRNELGLLKLFCFSRQRISSKGSYWARLRKMSRLSWRLV